MEDPGILPPKELATVDKAVFNAPGTNALANSEVRSCCAWLEVTFI